MAQGWVYGSFIFNRSKFSSFEDNEARQSHNRIVLALILVIALLDNFHALASSYILTARRAEVAL